MANWRRTGIWRHAQKRLTLPHTKESDLEIIN